MWRCWEYWIFVHPEAYADHKHVERPEPELWDRLETLSFTSWSRSLRPAGSGNLDRAKYDAVDQVRDRIRNQVEHT
jgi:hypothetical protein